MKKALFTLFTVMALHTAMAQTPVMQRLTGQWQLTASPFIGGADVIKFTATPSSDGTRLECHADNFYTRGSRPYPMDWQLAVEQNGDQLRLGWMLTADKPASTEEFQEPASKYALAGRDADGSHRYLYLLTENIETQRLEALTLWSEWAAQDATLFTLPKTYQIYGVVSPDQPCGTIIGYADIWASPRLEKTDNEAAIRTVTTDGTIAGPWFDLLGRALPAKPQKGLFICNGKIYLGK